MELLKWVKEVTTGYAGVNIQTWSNSFNDGNAFSAVLHAFRPEGIDYDKAAKLKPLKALEQAFDIAAAEPFNVPKLLDPQDVMQTSGFLDTKSLITYVAKLRQACLALQEAKAAEMEAARLANLAEMRAKEHAKTMEMLAALEKLSVALKKWCNDNESGFRKAIEDLPSLGLDTDVLQGKIDELKAFRHDEKPPKAADKAKLVDDHAALEARLLEQMANGTTPEDAVAGIKASMEACSPSVMTGVWNDMETAERDYEAALFAKLAEAEKTKRHNETDGLADPLMKKTDSLLKWINDETPKLVEGRKPENLGETAAAAKALLDTLKAWAADEKPPKESEKNQIQDGLREIAVRRAQEERDPLPDPYNAKSLEDAWMGLEAALAALLEALGKREAEKARQEAMAVTDQMKADVDEMAAKWKKEVDDKDAWLVDKLKKGDLGTTQEETQKLLDDYRNDVVGTKKPKWADEKVDIEAKRREVDARRADEGREPVAWEPSPAEMSDSWTALSKDGAAYEQALLDKLGQLKEEEKERLRLQALAEAAKSKLAELLPPMVARADAVDTAVSSASAKAKTAEGDLLPWVTEARTRLEGKLAVLKGDGVVSEQMMAGEAAYLDMFGEEEKPPKSLEFLALQEAVNDAIAIGSTQRYGGTEGKADMAKPISILGMIKNEWEAMEAAESGLRSELWRLKVQVQGPALLWERLRRGCLKQSEWLSQATPKLAAVGTTATDEGEAAAWLHSVETLYAESVLSKVAVEKLTALGEVLVADQPEYTARAAGALDSVKGVPVLVDVLKSKVEKLKEELARQRKLAQEKVVYAGAVAAFSASVDEAIELTSFPIPSIDTIKLIEDLMASGSKQLDGLFPSPEGAGPGSVAEAEDLKSKWTDLLSMLSMKMAEYTNKQRAKISGDPLQEEQASVTLMFNAWYDRCTNLLLIEPVDQPASPPQLAHVAKADIERAVAVAESQEAEGDVHTRRLEEIARQLESLGVAKASDAEAAEMVAATLTDLERSARSGHVKSLTKQLRSAIAAAPSDAPAPVPEVIQAFKDLAEGLGQTLSVKLIESELIATHSAFVLSHMPKGAPDADKFDPFPLDNTTASSRPLPKETFSPQAHGFAVLEALNRARTAPKAYAAELKESFAGCYEVDPSGRGSILSPPWGGMRVRTQEGEAALNDLVAYLSSSEPLPAIKLINAVSEASQELAIAVSKGEGTPPLDVRLGSRGKFSGMAAEAMCFGVRKPDAIVAWLLMCDGQPRNNRDYLLSADVTVGGMGLAEHPEQGSIATLTLLGLFATALNESKTVTCEGIPTKEFNEVLDAIPSEQIREMATEALAANKKVQVEYKVTEATLTIWTGEEGQAVGLQWA